MKKITLSHGSGGSLTHRLIQDIFARAFKNEYLDKLDDSALLDLKKGNYAYTTDSFVVDPLFFPGGDIGKLSVCGVINDLASCAARPLFMTCGFIIEEGLPLNDLRRIASSMAKEARKNNLKIVAGDTKVVPKGKADKIFINCSGVGIVEKKVGMGMIRPGDKVLINGDIARHGLSILLGREGFSYESSLESDCNSLWEIVELLIKGDVDVRFMRDPTRG
ncbi:MAG TPA: hydrogenase expression/formation protein HypE, partial [Candidatus Omnitrophota bacterium]|nr:hydrogenase expression/formation protein HypE [Candidatus Omnitrophota bacterium]